MGSAFRKGSQQTGQATGISGEQAAISRELFELARPGITTALGQLGTALETGQLPLGMTGQLGTQEQELQAARLGILNEVPRGGLQQQLLGELPLRRLLGRDELRGQLYNVALGALLGQAPTAISGLGSAAANLTGLGGQRIQQNLALQQGLGQLVGAGGRLALK